MESLITLFVIIVVFNLINALLKAFKGGKGPVRVQENDRPAAVSAPPPLREYEDEVRSYFMTGHLDRSDLVADEQENIAPSEPEVEKAAPAHDMSVVKNPSAAQGCSNVVTSNLQQVLQDKNSLITAFIFHEILSPPSALRKRR